MTVDKKVASVVICACYSGEVARDRIDFRFPRNLSVDCHLAFGPHREVAAGWIERACVTPLGCVANGLSFAMLIHIYAITAARVPDYKVDIPASVGAFAVLPPADVGVALSMRALRIRVDIPAREPI